MSCAGCNQLECATSETDVVTLITGEKVCNSCPNWRLECELRAIVNMGDEARKAHYRDIAKKRGEAEARVLVGQVNSYRRAAHGNRSGNQRA